MQPLGFPFETIIVLFVVVGCSVAIDLFAHRDKTEISFSDAAGWSVFWIFLAIGFYYYLDVRFGDEYASLFIAGYALEKSLSIDNMMVFVAIFSSFGIKGILQHRILYFGIVGALLFRAIFIAAGTSLFGFAPWVEFIFALIVAWTAYAMFKGTENKEEQKDYSTHWSVKMTKKIFPIFPRIHGKRFFITHKEVEKLQSENPSLVLAKKGIVYATPMFLCLMCIEISDIVFSFDSVPAIIAITREPLLVYSAVIFAILGLRNLYFMLTVAAKYLCHLDKAVAMVLVFVALKLGAGALEKTLGIKLFHISNTHSLFIVLSLIGIGIFASLIFPEKSDGGGAKM